MKRYLLVTFAFVIGGLSYVIATAQPQNPKTELAFDNVEIRAAAPNTMPQMRSRFGNGRYELRNATAVDLILMTLGVEADNISGGPDWLDLNRYDVTASSPAAAPPEMLRTLLQGMLKDRFQLSVRSGEKEHPAYVRNSRRGTPRTGRDARKAPEMTLKIPI